MSTKSFEQFMKEVDQDYWVDSNKRTQTRLAVELGAHMGYQFTEQDMEEYLYKGLESLTRVSIHSGEEKGQMPYIFSEQVML